MRTFLSAFILLFLSLHGGIGWFLHSQRPKLDVLPPLPTNTSLEAMAFGDRQFLYRSLVLEIQNAGDTGGRFTPMRNYDMAEVVAWLTILQRLDVRSNHYPTLAVRYFSWSNRPDDLRLLIDFVDRDAALLPSAKWYWQTQAVVMARDRLKDPNLALALAQKTRAFAPYIPAGYIWALQLEPLLLADLGRYNAARQRMAEILQDFAPLMNAQEKNWAYQFMEKLN